MRGAVPGVAPAAMQGGRYAARAIQRRLRGESVEPFHYLDKGTLATIGRAAAVAEIGRLKISGFVAWLLWLFVHILIADRLPQPLRGADRSGPASTCATSAARG